MSAATWGSIALVLLFILVSSVFVAAEIALVSLRDSQLRGLAQRSRRGQRVADLAADSNRFLATVQIGVTLAGFFSAAFGAATLAEQLAPVLEGWGLGPAVAQTGSLVGVTLVVSFVALVIGELVPKRLGLQRAEGVALALAPALDRLAQLARPVIWLLSRCTDVVVRLLGGDPGAQRVPMSEEELRDLVSVHEALEEEERRIVEDVFEAGDRHLREVMLPRTEVDFLDAATPVAAAVEWASTQPHSRYPVIRGSADDVAGFVHIRDLLSPAVAERAVRVGDLARDVPFLPGTKRLLSALTEMRREHAHLAIVVDEYGGTDGIVTLEDLVEELVGDIRDEYDEDSSDVAGVPGGPVDVDGLLNLEDFGQTTGVQLTDGPYETVAGYAVARLGSLPQVGDVVEVDEAPGRRLVVRELDGRRIARLRLEQSPPGDDGPSGTARAAADLPADLPAADPAAAGGPVEAFGDPPASAASAQRR